MQALQKSKWTHRYYIEDTRTVFYKICIVFIHAYFVYFCTRNQIKLFLFLGWSVYKYPEAFQIFFRSQQQIISLLGLFLKMSGVK